MLRHQKKKKGFLLIEGILMLALMTAVAFGMVSIMAGQFSTLSASKEANQAQQLAEYIASQLRQDGYENVEDFDMQESPKSADDFVGNSDLKGKYLYTVKKLSDFEVKEDSYNKVKLMEVKIYPTGYSNVPIYSLEVPLSSQAWAIPVGAVMAWPAEETPTSGGVWLECNGQTIDEKYKRLRELVGDKTPNYQGVFLRGYGSQTVGNINQGILLGRHNQKYNSGELNIPQSDTSREEYFTLPNVMMMDNHDFIDTTWSHPIGSAPVYWWQIDNVGVQSGLRRTYHNFNAYQDENGAIVAQNSYLGQPNQYLKAWISTCPPKKYALEGDSESGYNLIEEDDTQNGAYHDIDYHDIGWEEGYAYPISSEYRPVNVAVRYFIKAR